MNAVSALVQSKPIYPLSTPLHRIVYTYRQEICSRLINNERNRKSKNQTP